MIFAQIKNGKIVNTIVLENIDLVEAFTEGFDALIRIDDLEIIPGINWNHNIDDGFSAPTVPVLTMIETINKMGDDAEVFGKRLISDVRNENIALGITQLGITNNVRKILFQVADALRTGSLFDAIYEISILDQENFDQAILTPTRLLDIRNRIESYLAIPRSNAWDTPVL